MSMDYYPLNTIFTQKDLYWLDSLMPGSKKKAKEALRKKQIRRSKGRYFGCCGRGRGGKQTDEELMNDVEKAPMRPDIAVKIEDDLDKKQAHADGAITQPINVQSNKPVTALEPLLDNGTPFGVEKNE